MTRSGPGPPDRFPKAPRPGVAAGPGGGDSDGSATTHWEGEPVGVWEALWKIPLFEAWSRVGSTNDRARTLVGDGAAPFTVVVADEQTAGRGRSGRSWASAPGLGLWMSVILRLPPAEARLLAPILAGLAVCRAVEDVAPGLEPRLKWPNDVLLGHRKLCGVLCEAATVRPEAVVAGVGINVHHRPSDFPNEVRSAAVSLAMATGESPSRSRLAGRVVARLKELLSRPTLRLEGTLATELERRDALGGRMVQVPGGGPRGRAVGIDAGGALRLETETGGIVRLVAGSVRVVPG